MSTLTELRSALEDAVAAQADAQATISRAAELDDANETRTLDPDEVAEFNQLRSDVDDALETLEEAPTRIAGLRRRIATFERAIADHQAGNGGPNGGDVSHTAGSGRRSARFEPPAPGVQLTAEQTRSLVVAGIEHAAPIIGDAATEQAVRFAEGRVAGDAGHARMARATSNPHYLTAFCRAVQDPERAAALWTDDERAAVQAADAEMRAMSLTDAAGGFAVPYQLDPSIVRTGETSMNRIRDLATVRTTTSDEYRVTTASAVSARWAGEATETNDDSPSFDQITITPEKADSFVPYSIEIGEDFAGLATELGALFADAKDTLEAEAFANGDGADKPFGLLTRLGAAQTVTPAAAGVMTANDLRSLWAAVPSRYASKARWAMNRTNAASVQALGNGGDADFSIAFSDKLQALVVMGHPTGDVDELGDTAVLFGDLSAYRIVDRVGMVVELVPHIFGPNQRPTGQRGLYAHWRVGADLVNPDAIRRLDLA